MLTVLRVSSALVLTLIILVPIRPSRQNVISMPRVRRNVCVRRRRPASARGLFVPGVPLENSSRAVSAHCTYASGCGVCFNDALDGGSAVITTIRQHERIERRGFASAPPASSARHGGFRCGCRRCHPLVAAGTGMVPIVADAADGADGSCEPCMHPDDPASSAAFTTKGDVDAQEPQESRRSA
jgi:hypothetical protein